jgi:hypothetical protein
MLARQLSEFERIIFLFEWHAYCSLDGIGYAAGWRLRV